VRIITASCRRSDFCRARLGLPLNRLNERGRALLLSPLHPLSERRRLTRAFACECLSSFRSVHPPNLSGEQPGKRSCYRRDYLFDVSFRTIKELPYSSGRPTMFAVWSWSNDAWYFGCLRYLTLYHASFRSSGQVSDICAYLRNLRYNKNGFLPAFVKMMQWKIN